MASYTVLFALFTIFVLLLFRRTFLSLLVSSKTYKRYFAALQNKWGAVPRPTEIVRQKVLAKLNEMLAESGGDVLEIGAASGRNFAYMNLPEGSSYIALDYNPEMEHYLRENLKKYPNNNIPLKQFIVEDATNMRSIKDNSMAAVLGVQVLCSLGEGKVKQVLKEIKRVLKPGGYYFFLEHVIDEPKTIRRALSIFCTFIGLPLLFDGCRMDKETWKDIERAGFQKVDYQKGCEPRFFSWSYPGLSFAVYLAAVKIHGYAVKS